MIFEIHIEIDGKMKDASIYQTTDLVNQSFINLIYVRYGNEELILRLQPDVEIILNSSTFIIEDDETVKGLQFIPMYKNIKSNNIKKITIDNLVLIISNYMNPQIRNGIMIINLKNY